MASVKYGAKKNQLSLGVKPRRYSSVHVQRRSDLLHKKKNSVTPRNDPTRPDDPATTTVSTEKNQQAKHCSMKRMSRLDQSTVKTKDEKMSFSSGESKLISSYPSFTLNELETAGNREREEKKQKRRRRGGLFQMTPCCCCSSIMAILFLLLLAVILAAVILWALRAKGTTTTTTSTSSTSTTSTTTTSTSSTSSTSTATDFICQSCHSRCWNQTEAVVAGTDTVPFSDPRCINFDVNDTMYLCAHQLGYVQEWHFNSPSRTAATANYGDHIDYVIFDRNENIYTNAHNKNLVRAYPAGSLNGTIIAGTGSSVSGTLKRPTGIAMDEDLTLYIADQNNQRVVKVGQNATSLMSVIDTTGVVSTLAALLFPNNSSNEIYLSDEGGTKVFLWELHATSPRVIYTNVIDGTTLKEPRGMKLDDQGNLYVADQKNHRVVVFCPNSTTGYVIAQMSSEPVDIAFDSQMNLYAIVSSGAVFKFHLL